MIKKFRNRRSVLWKFSVRIFFLSFLILSFKISNAQIISSLSLLNAFTNYTKVSTPVIIPRDSILQAFNNYTKTPVPIIITSDSIFKAFDSYIKISKPTELISTPEITPPPIITQPTVVKPLETTPSLTTDVTTALRTLLKREEFISEIRGLPGEPGKQGPIGPQGPAGQNGTSASSVVTVFQPNPATSFAGGSLFNATDLSSTNFITTNASITTLNVSGNITGDTISLGSTGGTTGIITMKGTTSGTITIQPADTAGTYTLTLPTTDGTASQFLQTDGSGVLTWADASGGGGDALVANPLSQFAATTSLQLKDTISDETGSGALVFATSPALVTPDLGIPTALTLTNATGLPATSILAGTLGAGAYTIDTSLTLGATGSNTGSLLFKGTTSGTVTIQTADTAGTYTLTLPTTDGTASQFLQTDGSGVLTWADASGGGGADTALSNLASVAINTSLVSDTYNTDALGSSAVGWSDLFLGNGSVIDWSSAASTSDVTLTHSADTLTFAGGTIVLGNSNVGVATGTSLSVSGQVASTVATGTAPLAVSSTTKVANLNADLLDGLDSSAFGDATAANQTTILSRIGTAGDAASMSGSLFAGQQYIWDNRASFGSSGGLGDWTWIGGATGSSAGTSLDVDLDSYTANEFIFCAVDVGGGNVESTWVVVPAETASNETGGTFTSTASPQGKVSGTAGACVLWKGGDVPGTDSTQRTTHTLTDTAQLRVTASTNIISVYQFTGAAFSAGAWYR